VLRENISTRIISSHVREFRWYYLDLKGQIERVDYTRERESEQKN